MAISITPLFASKNPMETHCKVDMSYKPFLYLCFSKTGTCSYSYFAKLLVASYS